MGGDGGVIAVNRRYMRGAGQADHTADLQRNTAEKVKFNAKEAMTTCAITKKPLYVVNTNTTTTTTTNNNNNNNTMMIVSDVYGKLYHREAAVKALLKRKQQQQSDATTTATFDDIGPQVRRLNDLYDVRFYYRGDERGSNNSHNNIDTFDAEEKDYSIPTCPITGKALNGNIPAILLVIVPAGSTKSNNNSNNVDDNGDSSSIYKPNVVSESALKQLTFEELQEEFGIIMKKVRLAPSPILLEQIKEEVREEHDKDELRRKEKKLLSNKKKHKRKRGKNDTQNNCTNKGSDKKRSKGAIDNNNSSSKKTKATRLSSSSSSSVGQEIQSRVDSAIQQNSILSSIFTKERKITEKEKNDNLFAR